MTDLAAAAGVSVAMVSRVIAGLRADGTLTAATRRGARSGLRPTMALFQQTSSAWPKPQQVAALKHDAEGLMAEAATGFGGGELYQSLQLSVDAPPRAYFRNRSDLLATAVWHGWQLVDIQYQSLVPHPLEVVVLPFDVATLPPGLLAALEIAGDPRGDEIVAGHPELLCSIDTH